MAPSSAEHAKRLLERSNQTKPIQRFDSADYFLSQHIDQQKLEVAKQAIASRRLSPREEGSSTEASRSASPMSRPTSRENPPSPAHLGMSSLKIAQGPSSPKSPSQLR